MVNREIVMDYILSCLQDLVKTVWKLSPTAISSTILAWSHQSDGSLNDAGRQIRYFHSYNILLDVKTPAQLMETLLPWLRINNGAIR